MWVYVIGSRSLMGEQGGASLLDYTWKTTLSSSSSESPSSNHMVKTMSGPVSESQFGELIIAPSSVVA